MFFFPFRHFQATGTRNEHMLGDASNWFKWMPMAWFVEEFGSQHAKCGKENAKQSLELILSKINDFDKPMSDCTEPKIRHDNWLSRN